MSFDVMKAVWAKQGMSLTDAQEYWARKGWFAAVEICKPTGAHERIMAELARAKALHGGWPDKLDRMTMRTTEEALEVAESAIQAALKLVRAVNDHMDHGEPLEDVAKELTHLGATVYRMLEALEPPRWECRATGYPAKSCILAGETPAGQWCRDAGPTVNGPMECAYARIKK